ncbi:MAG TPA: DUF4118 domain-containing protein [Vicinamibacterales bacterium]|jgi:two-component system sensor histidine kinase KdpD|nr:DUF4118 domain-containing protein [Vicinamibacterales bacterium]
MMSSLRRHTDGVHLLLALGAATGVTTLFVAGLHVRNPTTAALAFLLIVLFTAAASHLWVAIVTSIASMFLLNYFFLPPFHTLVIADPQNWVALFAFLAVSLVASRLSTIARVRQRDALQRRDELARLFDLSRDILMSTESGDAMAALARQIAARFDLPYAAVYLPTIGRFERYESDGAHGRSAVDTGELNRALALTQSTNAADLLLTPLRVGDRAIGLLATAGTAIHPDTLPTLAGLAAIAIERAHFLEERRQAEIAQRSAELKSTLLASLAHDLRTPLTAIRIAAENLRGHLDETEREEQIDLVLAEVERLSRLFHNILEMATIDSGTIAPTPQWVHPLEIVEAAQHQVEYALRGHKVVVSEAEAEDLVYVDPRLTANALAHLLENAAHYSPPGSSIFVECGVTPGGLRIGVRDQGSGLREDELPHLFDRYYRGSAAGGHSAGSGMGLAIARGLLAAEGGTLSAANAAEGGARFAVLVPTEHRALAV